MNYEIECVVPSGDKCGEGATWCAEESALYWCDINRFLIHRYQEETGVLKSWFFDEPVVAMSLTYEKGKLLVALASRLIWWTVDDDLREDFISSQTGDRVLCDGFPDVRFNEGRSDPNGNFWVGSMKNNVLANGELGEVGPGKGVLFRVTPSGEITPWRDNIGISNTMCWDKKLSKFYFADTLANEIFQFDFEAKTSEISNERSFIKNFDRGLPDGSQIDEDGYIWNCRYDGGCIVRLSPSGKIDQIIEMPVSNITTCTFGGKDLKTLYVTTAGNQAPSGERLAGSLYRLKTDVAGLSEHRFGQQVA